MAKIYSPVKGYTGKVAGVTFADGVGESSDLGAIAYFRRHGYKVGGSAPTEQVKTEGDGEAKTGEFSLAEASIPEMRAYAKAQGIAIPSEAKKAAEIRAIIEEATKVPETISEVTTEGDGTAE